MKVKIGSLFITAMVLFNLSACGYIKSLFPDKEKDYQYTTEIPPLILPDDLKKDNSPILNSAAPSPATSNVSDATVADKAPIQEAAPAVSPENEAVIPDTAITVERVKLDNSENHLRLNVPLARAWHIAGKALSRKSIEVTERDQEAGLFTVLYDPDEQKVEDDSYWDEVVFMFRGFQANEKTYLLKLEEDNKQTDIVIVDTDQKPLSDEASLKLLSLLEETIKADLAQK